MFIQEQRTHSKEETLAKLDYQLIAVSRVRKIRICLQINTSSFSTQFLFFTSNNCRRILKKIQMTQFLRKKLHG